MLKDRECTVMIDGFETRSFKIGSGVPKGDTASPYLFTINSTNKNKTGQQTTESNHKRRKLQERRRQ